MAQLPRQRVEIGELRERLRTVYRRGAELHRRMQERQLAAARLHEAYADRLEQQADQPWPAPPPFMTAVAQALGACGATAALYGRSSDARPGGHF